MQTIKNKILGVIPARGGSKGIPKKNIKEMNGKPLIHYSIDAALKSKIDKIVVSTEDEKIIEIVKSYDVEILKRPNSLAKDNAPSFPVVKHVIDSLDDNYNIIITLQPTSPLRKFYHINDAIEKFYEYKNIDSLVSVVEIPHNMTPESAMELQDNGLIKHYERGFEKQFLRQNKKTFYARNGAAIYITTIQCILNKHSLIGDKVVPFLMKRSESVDIDDNFDWLIAEFLLKNNS